MAYESHLASPGLDRLFTAILSLRDREDCYRFFEDLCTVGEMHAMAQRLEVAAMLRAGRTYEEIQAATGMSSATISRIKRFLQYGADGYRRVLDRLEKGEGEGTTLSARSSIESAGRRFRNRRA